MRRISNKCQERQQIIKTMSKNVMKITQEILKKTQKSLLQNNRGSITRNVKT